MPHLMNFYLVCDITLVEKEKHFFIPVPLFLVDVMFEFWWVVKPFIKRIPQKYTDNWLKEINIDSEKSIEAIELLLRKSWRHIRNCGRYTLADVETTQVKVKIKLF